ncbi:DUF1134 domain-containing protein [Sphingoaurantiacus capsulatus]|uniref:DUF1134 domain-containing protein n=1 Tax=Sphingoaurantiacus capsulatus TaxID=1771310 RepID=A0ABV7XDX4_9SPHN
MTIRTALPALLAFALVAAPVAAQTADEDLAPIPEDGVVTTTPAAPVTPPAPTTPAEAPAAPVQPASYEQDDILAAAEGVFGKGAEGAAKLIEKAFADLGKPNAYIAGREVSGAIVVGVRYGSGVLHHKVEGDQPVHWTGPSVGFDVGGDGSKTFTLIYNLNDAEELFRRYPAVEGKVYVLGGFTANYHQRGDTILVPIKLGVGWRLGANVGYLSYSKKAKILPL